MSFIWSKILWVFLSPGNILVLLLLLSGFLAMAHSKAWQNFGHRLAFNVAFLLFFIAIFPVGDWLLLPLENRFPPVTPEHVDGIIVLGGDESPHISEMRGQPTLRESASRLIEFVTLARKYPQAKLVYTGGSGLLVPDSNMKDTEVVRQTLKGLGLPFEHVIFEDQSRNTYENAVKSSALIHPTPQQNWLLVTSAWHMPRAIGCFHKAGWNVSSAPTDYRTDGQLSSKLQFSLHSHLTNMTIAAHEYYGLVAYWLMGYTNGLWPK